MKAQRLLRTGTILIVFCAFTVAAAVAAQTQSTDQAQSATATAAAAAAATAAASAAGSAAATAALPLYQVPEKYAQGWDPHLRSLLYRAEYKRVETILKHRLKALQAQRNPDQRQLLKALDQLTEMEIVLNDLPQAQQFEAQAIRVARKQPRPMPMDLIARFHRLAEIQDVQPALRHAEKNYGTELMLTERRFGIDEAADLLPLHSLGRNLEAQRKFADAKKYYLRELKLMQRIYGADHFSLSSNYIDLGRLAAKQSELDVACEHYDHALKLLQKGEDEDNDPRIREVQMRLSEIGTRKAKLAQGEGSHI